MPETTAFRDLTPQEAASCLERIHAALSCRADADVQAAAQRLLSPLSDGAAMREIATSNVSRCLQSPSFERCVQTLRYTAAEVETLAVAAHFLLRDHADTCAFYAYAQELLTALYLDRRVYGHAFRVLLDHARTEDALQELFCRLLYPYGEAGRRLSPKLLRYDPRKRFESWFLVVRRNFMLDLRRFTLQQSARFDRLIQEAGGALDASLAADDPARMAWDKAGAAALADCDGFLEAYARRYAALAHEDAVKRLYLSCLCECGLNRLRAQKRANAELAAGGPPSPSAPRVTDYARERWYYEMLDSLIATLCDRMPDSAAFLRMYMRARPGRLPVGRALDRRLQESGLNT